MSDGIYAALSGGIVQLRRLEVLANNLANVGTAGFKRDRLLVGERPGAAGEKAAPFETVLSRARAAGASGAEARGTAPDLSQGPTIRTDAPLDVALVGEGFLAVETAAGLRLTRDGRLAVAADGTLVTRAGDPLVGESGAINVAEAGQIEITPDGEVIADGMSAGRLRVVRSLDPRGPQKAGGGLFDPGKSGVEDVEAPEVLQGFVEGSNVEPVTTLVELISAQRSFEASQQMIRAHKDLDDQAIRKVQAPR